MVSDAALSVETRARKRKRDLDAQRRYPGRRSTSRCRSLKSIHPIPRTSRLSRGESRDARRRDATGRKIEGFGEFKPPGADIDTLKVASARA